MGEGPELALRNGVCIGYKPRRGLPLCEPRVHALFSLLISVAGQSHPREAIPMLRSLVSAAVLLSAIFTTFAVLDAGAPVDRKEKPSPDSPLIIGLRTQLERGLRANRPDQVALVDRVIKLVKSGDLSLRTVNAAYRYARKRRPSFPFPYFERTLRTLAAQEGATI